MHTDEFFNLDDLLTGINFLLNAFQYPMLGLLFSGEKQKLNQKQCLINNSLGGILLAEVKLKLFCFMMLLSVKTMEWPIFVKREGSWGGSTHTGFISGT